MLRFNEEKRYLIFKLSWVLLLLGTICDLELANVVVINNFPLTLQSSSIVLLIYIFTFFALVPVNKIKEAVSENFYKYSFILLGLLVLTAIISSAFSHLPKYALHTTLLRYLLYYICCIITYFYTRLFKESTGFIVQTFIYANILILISCLLDYYYPLFNGILVKYFGHMEKKHITIKIGDNLFFRPSGFITEPNLTSLSISMAVLLLIFNNKSIKNEIVKYIFYFTSGYIFGMLGSRSVLIVVISVTVVTVILKTIERKKIIIPVLIFIMAQLFTPQTLGWITQRFGQSYIEDEMTMSWGRPMIWKGAMVAFSSSPVIGIGTSVFFMESKIFISIAKGEKSSDFLDTLNYRELKIEEYDVNPHSIFFVMLAEYGVIGTIIFLAFIFFNFRSLIKYKFLLSILFSSGLLFVSLVSGYVPYYKYYLIICIIIFILQDKNMMLDTFNNAEKIDTR